MGISRSQDADIGNLKILIFIPCYNCSKQIRRVLSKIEKQHDQVEKILLIDNCSTDNTVETIKNFRDQASSFFQKKILIGKNFQNYGLGGSFKLATEYARQNGFTHLQIFHGDDQGDFRNALQMQEILKKNQDLEVILGSRFMQGARLFGYSKSRILGNLIFNWLFSIILQKKILDIGSGINLYSLKVLPHEFIRKLPDHAAFDVLLLFHFIENKVKIQFSPTSWSENDQISTVRNFQIAFIILRLLLKFKLNRSALGHIVDPARGFSQE